ncbi:MAG: FecR domain-containing protein [Fibrobacterota bacterium]
MRNSEKKFILILMPVFLAVGFYIVRGNLFGPEDNTDFRKIRVAVKGNVERPELFEVDYGTTYGEVLKMAGINRYSDINHIELAEIAEEDDTLQVGQKNTPVGFKRRGAGSFVIDACVLYFFSGEVEVFKNDGVRLDPKPGLFLNEGYVLTTGANGAAELRFKDGSRFTASSGSNIRIERLSIPVDGGINMSLKLNSGYLWGRVPKLTVEKKMSVVTENAEVTVTGTEFEVSYNDDSTEVKVQEGRVQVTPTAGGNGISLARGQKTLIAGDAAEQALQPEPIGREDSPPEAEFSVFESEIDDHYKMLQDYTFLYVGEPNFYVVVRLKPQIGKIDIVHIPPNLMVSDFVEGVSSLDKAAMYGGMRFTMALMEKVLQTKIDRYMIQTRRDVSLTINMLGGVEVTVDAIAAEEINLPAGRQVLNGSSALKYMNPGISGRQDSYSRQGDILLGCYRGLRSGAMTLNESRIGRILSGIDTNIPVSFAMRVYQIFKSRESWDVTTRVLPGASVVKEGSSYVKPAVNEIQRFLNEIK